MYKFEFCLIILTATNLSIPLQEGVKCPYFAKERYVHTFAVQSYNYFSTYATFNRLFYFLPHFFKIIFCLNLL